MLQWIVLGLIKECLILPDKLHSLKSLGQSGGSALVFVIQGNNLRLLTSIPISALISVIELVSPCDYHSSRGLLSVFSTSLFLVFLLLYNYLPSRFPVHYLPTRANFS